MPTVITWKIPADGGPTSKLDSQFETLDLASKSIPKGGYTTFRTFEKSKAVHLAEHFRRLEETARLTGLTVSIPESNIRDRIRQGLPEVPSEEVRIRMTVDLSQSPGDVYVSFEPLTVPSALQYQQGVKVVTRAFSRQNPKAKQSSFIEQAQEIRRSLPAGIYEALMVDEQGFILEGLSSNFFAIQSGALWTSEEGVLPGITRTMVLEEAVASGIPVHLESIQMADISALEEAFITSSSRGVLPVVEIDGVKIGSGLPGKITAQLYERYNTRLDMDLQPI